MLNSHRHGPSDCHLISLPGPGFRGLRRFLWRSAEEGRDETSTQSTEVVIKLDKVSKVSIPKFVTVTLLLALSIAIFPSLFQTPHVVAALSFSVTNVQVNQPFPGPFPTNKQNEPSLAQNPTNPLNLISGSNDEIGEPACTNTTPSSCPFVNGISVSGFYASFDGGLSWRCQGLIDLSSQGEFGFGDPTQAFDSKGNAYYGNLAFPFPPTTEEQATGVLPDLFVAKSTNGGCTYPTIAKVSGASPAIFNDKPSITADSNPASPFRDSVYASWTSFTNGADIITFSRSTDGGATWSIPLHISPAYSASVTGFRQGSSVKVGPDGTVFVFWFDFVNKTPVQRLSISHDGGKTFPSQNILVAPVTDDNVFAKAPGTSFRQFARVFPSVSITSQRTIYVAWTERNSGHGVVRLTKSTTSGLTWTSPIVAGNVVGRSAFFSSVAVDPSGNVDLVFLAVDDVSSGTAPGAGVVLYDAYFAQSIDGGTSFSSPLKLSTAASDPDGSSTNGLSAQFLGDYITTVADSGHVFAVWTDSRNASTCGAVDAFRAGTASKPDVIAQCPDTFGNTDIFLGTVS